MDGSTAQGRAGGQGGFEPTPQIIDMASTEELVEAIYRLIASSPTPIPVTLMNHGVDETAAIIGAVVERCARDNIALTEIFLDPDLAELLGPVDGGQLPHGSRPTVRCDAAQRPSCGMASRKHPWMTALRQRESPGKACISISIRKIFCSGRLFNIWYPITSPPHVHWRRMGTSVSGIAC